MEFNVADLIERVAKNIPDREAVIYGDQRATYRHFARDSGGQVDRREGLVSPPVPSPPFVAPIRETGVAAVYPLLVQEHSGQPMGISNALLGSRLWRL